MYTRSVMERLEKKGIRVGDKIKIESEDIKVQGILLPKSGGESDTLVIKLDSGYNIGVKLTKNMKIEKIERKRLKKIKTRIGELKIHPNKPIVSILGCGGTVASKVDYETGAVSPTFDPRDLIEMYPEVASLANVRFRLLFNTFSENLRFKHYKSIAREIVKEIKNGCEGIIITHGTDTMHYTAAALAFMFQSLPLPVILVGSQRSSDRGSSDAFLNLLSATRFIVESDFAGVAICMHESSSDDTCSILPPCRTRKVHSSRRDAFKPIDAKPIARVGGTIEFFVEEYERKDKKKKPVLKPKFEEKVGLLKLHTNMDPKILDAYKNYKGLVLEGFGLGHAPIEDGNEAFFRKLKVLAKKCIVVMTTQTIFGEVNMNVYATGRKLQEIGVIPCSMLPEVAFIKLAWLLGNYSPSKARELMRKNLRGEFRSWDTFEFGKF